MKKQISLLLTFFAMAIMVHAQAPNAIPYQGVARNSSGSILASQAIRLRLTIHDVTAAGTIVYQETQAVTTSTLGLFNINIGQGTIVTGTLGGVNWGGGAKFLQVEMDPTGGTSYISMGTTQLNSVPYALFAGSIPTGAGWSLSGNTGTVDGTNFIGTIDNVPLNIKVYNQPAGRIDPFLQNAFFGLQSGAATSSGRNNAAFGNYSLNANTSGFYNIAIGYEALYANTIGTGNLARGAFALYSNVSGNYNNAVGYTALYNNTTGSYNNASGYAALNNNTTGSYNGATGYSALLANTTGTYNIANGFNALYANTTGSGNLANGANALRYNTIGNYNTATGYTALYSNTSGSYNIANGNAALYSNTTGSYNTANGYNALYANTIGSGKLANGACSLQSNTTGSYNTAEGFQALSANTTRSGNLAFGAYALPFNTTGSYNIATGSTALYTNTIGNYNNANGFQALYYNTTGSYNNAFGYAALQRNTTGSQNTANGYQALFSNTTGSNNTALGYAADVASGILSNATAIGSGAIALTSNTIQLGNSAVTQVMAGTGSNAILIAGGLKITGGAPAVGKVLTSDESGIATWQTPGNSTGWSLGGNSGTVDGTNFIGTIDNVPFNIRVNNIPSGRIDGSLQNTFYGYQSGSPNSTGGSNTSDGYQALYSNTTGVQNTAAGANALNANTTGVNNTAVGYGSLSYNTTGINNTSVGYNSLYFNTTANYNTSNGYAGLGHNSTGSYNTTLGAYADVNADGYTNSTAVGSQATITGSNQVVLGNTAITAIYAEVTGITALSDGRFKKNIRDNVPGLEFIKLLNPVTYNYDIKDFNTHIAASPEINKMPNGRSSIQPEIQDQAAIAQKEKIQYTGLIAQDVEIAANRVGYDFSGLHKPQNDKDTYGLNYTDFVVPLIKSVQELSAQNDSLQNQNASQQRQINSLKNANTNQEQINNNLQQQLNELKSLVLSIQLCSPCNSANTKEQTYNTTITDGGSLEQNVPNPFDKTTTIRYNLPQNFNSAQIVITDKNGTTLKVIAVSGSGKGSLVVDTPLLAAGAYNYSLIVDGRLIGTKQMILAR